MKNRVNMLNNLYSRLCGAHTPTPTCPHTLKAVRTGCFMTHSLTYTEKLRILVGHTQGSLAIVFARGGVLVALLRERGEMGNGVGQPETLRMVKEQNPCGMHESTHLSMEESTSMLTHMQTGTKTAKTFPPKLCQSVTEVRVNSIKLLLFGHFLSHWSVFSAKSQHFPAELLVC